ncbi:hypothetical protein WJX81_004947 [Elliptochloris bilobata]|uniref:DNA endonuclease activator Ctp1 C-terminal domain-containing protein n=1 Tax=Elliptochloris bilobata TaxID=381761 RepID=A0AAW1QVC4_9CHLO
MVSTSDFPADVHCLVAEPGQLSEDAARAFLSLHPLPEIFERLQAGGLSAAAVADTAAALEKLFDTRCGQELLSAATPYALAALTAAAPQLRRLGAKHIGRMLLRAGQPAAAAGSGGAAAAPTLAAAALAGALGDPDTGVAAEASAALVAAGGVERGVALLVAPEGARPQLQRALEDPKATVRLRALALLAALASRGAAQTAAVRASGLLRPLANELAATEDLLGCSAALALLGDLAGGSPGGASALLAEVAPQLDALLSHPEALLRCQALKVAANLLATSAEDDAASHMDVDGAASDGAAGQASGIRDLATPRPRLLQQLGAILARDGPAVAGSNPNSNPALVLTLTTTALDAAGLLGATRAGADLLLADTRVTAALAAFALQDSGRTEERTAALHALATAGGAERAGGVAAALAARRAALVPPAEAALRGAVFRAAAARAGAPTPAEPLLAALRQPDLELRVAAYRMVLALGLRPWGVVAVGEHAGLRERLLDSRAESARQGCEWRFAALQALFVTACSMPDGTSGAPVANGGGGAPYEHVEPVDGDFLAALEAAAELIQARFAAAEAKQRDASGEMLQSHGALLKELSQLQSSLAHGEQELAREQQKRKRAADDLTQALRYRSKAKQLEVKLCEAHSKLAELQAAVDLAAESCDECDLARRLVAAEQRAAREREELDRLRHSSRAERRELKDHYHKLREAKRELEAEQSADRKQLSVLRERLAAYESGGVGQEPKPDEVPLRHQAKRKTPDQDAGADSTAGTPAIGLESELPAPRPVSGTPSAQARAAHTPLTCSALPRPRPPGGAAVGHGPCGLAKRVKTGSQGAPEAAALRPMDLNQHRGLGQGQRSEISQHRRVSVDSTEGVNGRAAAAGVGGDGGGSRAPLSGTQGTVDSGARQPTCRAEAEAAYAFRASVPAPRSGTPVAAARARGDPGRAAEAGAGGRPRPGSPGYKYREVVRNRAERAELPGYECPDCKRFYDALQTWGAAPLPPPICGHAAPGTTGAAAAAHAQREVMRHAGSRHRYRHTPPDTPPGFWKVGFPGDSMEPRV